MADNQPQSDKFKALARGPQCDEYEAPLDEKLKRMAKQEPNEAKRIPHKGESQQPEDPLKWRLVWLIHQVV